MSGWRRNTIDDDLISPRAHDGPPDEPDGPCQAAGCPRTGTITGPDILCAWHRGDDTIRAGHRRIGHRGGDPW